MQYAVKNSIISPCIACMLAQCCPLGECLLLRHVHDCIGSHAMLCLQNYKESCQNIIYDCNTDGLSATCTNNLPNVDPQSAAASTLSSLASASACIGVEDGATSNIANAGGILQCQTIDAGSTSGYLYSSRLDSSGLDAPDGVRLLDLLHTLSFCVLACLLYESFSPCGSYFSVDEKHKHVGSKMLQNTSLKHCWLDALCMYCS